MHNLSWTMILLLLTLTTIFNLTQVVSREMETYIVQVSSPQDHTFAESEDLESWYNEFMPSMAADSDQKPQMVYPYRNVLKGFAARLTAAQANDIIKKDGVISARPQRIMSLQTTRTPKFLGLHQNLGFWRGSNYGKGIIIGLLDSGITPGHPSTGVPPPPAKWKGKCEVAECNKKLIGVRNFVTGGSSSPLDDDGHGTHTSSTAAGNFVENANTLGIDNGMAPLAHVAMYKVCDEDGCPEGDVLAAMDAAIEEGVDVLSISIGGPSKPLYGAFTAIQKGIFVSCAAGNSGPYNASLSNEAPWILTVGASTVDRKVRATVKLGNGALLDGQSVFQPKDFPETLFPLVYPGINGDINVPGSLNYTDVKGKVVLCIKGGDVGSIAKGRMVKDAGGAAMILANMQIDAVTTLAETHVLPVSHVGYKDGLVILDYLNSTSSPVAGIVFQGAVIGDKSAPQVPSFSSRGPNLATPGILKPDIIGPGVSILAAWPASFDNKTTTTPFNVISGTSMACPHLGGIATLLKSVHPYWSPAAIKFAIMTTADLVNLNNQPIEDEQELPANNQPRILKPDIIGPGVSILAEWPASFDNKTTTTPFNVISGTSMACPHLGGIATLLKSAHPDWSPAAIKFAIMTTADLVNLNNELIEDEQELHANNQPGILKPDIIGPGVSILAAWPAFFDNKTTTTPFNVISGTSMACPHLGGIATLLKSAHPDWSPAAIKSAIMTTADLVNLNNQPIEDEQELPANLFAVGAGHVNPSKANDPGLIYDIQPDDYIPYLCGLGYSNENVTTIVQKQVSCSNISSIPEAQLNYPSFAVTLNGNETKTYTRTVTNVGDANSTYTVRVITRPGVVISVLPSTLTFSAVNQKLSYQVTFMSVGSAPSQFVEGALEWNSAKHSVRIPISIKYV